MAISQRFAIPTNDDDFERMCLELLRLYWSRPGLEIFGKRGERQFGIDILDLAGETPIYAAQCKLKEEHKSLPPGDIEEEVEKAKTFYPPLGKYGILTSGKVSTRAQRKIREINESHKKTGLFEVELFTWDRLCSLLQQYESVQEQFYGGVGLERAGRMSQDLLQIKDGVESLTSKISGTEIDSEINEARERIKDGEFQLGKFLLNRLQKKHAALTSQQKFQVLSNIGAATLAEGKNEEAARYFLEASSYQPEDEKGQTNEILAYLLVEDLTKSHSKADILRRRYPASARIIALWIATAPQTIPFEQLEAETSAPLRSDAEVSTALARRAAAEFHFDKARTYSIAAKKASPRWAQAELVQAEIDFREALYLQSGAQPLNEQQVRLLQSAEQACDRAINVARAEKDRNSELTVLLQRAEVRLLLNEHIAAAEDAQIALHMAPDDARVLFAVGHARLEAGRVDEGISILNRAYILNPISGIAFTLGQVLRERGLDGDIDSAIKMFRGIRLSTLREDLRYSVLMQVMQCCLKSKNWNEAELYLNEASEDLELVVVEATRGYIAHHRGSASEAEQHALRAHSLLAANAIAETKSFVARLLMLVGRPGDALPIWQTIFDLDAPGFDPGNLLDCAVRLHKDDVILKTCEKLHARGVNDWQLIEFELPYLHKYDFERAIERLRTFLKEHPGHTMALLRLSLFGLLLNRPELVQANLDSLPSVSELPPEWAISAVHVLRFGGSPRLAVDYAYRYLRAHFDDVNAHQAMIASMMPGPPELDIPPKLDAVAPNAAVCYREFVSGEEKWVVLEATEDLSSEFEEISLSWPLAIELLGRRVGDTFVLAKGEIQDRKAQIVQILPKYVRRYQDSMTGMQVRFGVAGGIESVHVESHMGELTTESIDPLLSSLQRRAAAVDQVRAIYIQSPVSLHMYGAGFGSNAYEALIDLARAEDQPVKCTLGTETEKNNASKCLETAQAIVLDITALATLRLLGLTSVLSSARFRFILPQSVFVALHEMSTDARMHLAAGGSFSYESGRPTLYEEATESQAARNKEQYEILGLIETATEIQASMGLAELDPPRREFLERAFGHYGAESMIIASTPNYVLWTDDLVQSQTAAAEFGVRRVWTQLVLEVAGVA